MPMVFSLARRYTSRSAIQGQIGVAGGNNSGIRAVMYLNGDGCEVAGEERPSCPLRRPSIAMTLPLQHNRGPRQTYPPSASILLSECLPSCVNLHSSDGTCPLPASTYDSDPPNSDCTPSYACPGHIVYSPQAFPSATRRNSRHLYPYCPYLETPSLPSFIYKDQSLEKGKRPVDSLRKNLVRLGALSATRGQQATFPQIYGKDTQLDFLEPSEYRYRMGMVGSGSPPKRTRCISRKSISRERTTPGT